MFFRILFLLLLLSLTGCTCFHSSIKAPEADIVPEKYTLYTEKPDAKTPWWKAFNNQELGALINRGLTHSYTLQQEWAKVAQARAVAQKSHADSLPELQTSFDAEHDRSGGKNKADSTSNDLDLELSAGYELDLWGRIAAAQQQDLLEALATREDAYTAAMTLSSEIALAWLDIIKIKQARKLLRQQLDLNNKLLDLVTFRFRVSQVSALDVYQQRQSVKSIEGELIEKEGELTTTTQQLAILLGQSPTELIQIQQESYPDLSDIPPGGIPADLLAQRPDIRAAGFQLQKSTWLKAEAKADRLPKLSLSASYSYSATTLASLLDNWLLELAAGISAPIFDGGEKAAEVERAQAVIDEQLAIYRQTVLEAIGEVEKALVQEQQYRKSLVNIKVEIDLTKKAYREATWRYLNGLTDYLSVLHEQESLITNQLSQNNAEYNLLAARISLHRALGGSWPQHWSQIKERLE